MHFVMVGHPALLPDSDTAWPDDAGAAMQIFLDEQLAMLPVVRQIEAPDAVLYDIGGFSGRVAALRLGVPTIQLSPTYVAWEGYEQDMAEFTETLKASPSTGLSSPPARSTRRPAGERDLREAVAAALEQAPRARELMAEARRGGGPAIAADAVERLAQSPPSAARR